MSQNETKITDEDNAVFIEAELLRGMYPSTDELEITIQDPDHITFLLHLLPHSAGGINNIYVKSSLELGLTISTYPDTQPTIQLKKSRGLEDTQQRTLLALLQTECEALAGDYVCSTLAQVTQDFLTDGNKPPRCSICLESIANDGTDCITTCFHFFHAACLTSWYERCAMSFATGFRGISKTDYIVECQKWQSLVGAVLGLIKSW